jgi:ABC-type taurine transport system ATPase subunit
MYDAKGNQITQTVGVADEAAPTLSVLLGRELDRPSTSVDGGFRRQIDVRLTTLWVRTGQ